MKINKQKNKSHLKIIVIITLVLAVVATAGVYAYMQINGTNIPSSTQSGVDYNPPTDEQKAAGDAQKEETINKEDEGVSSGNNQGNDVEVSFSAINQADGQLLVRALIDSVSNEGTCTLTLSKGGTVVTKTSGVQSGPNSSTCKGFNVPVGELSPGEWRLVLDIQVNSNKGSATRMVTVE